MPGGFKCQEEELNYPTTPKRLQLGDMCCIFIGRDETFRGDRMKGDCQETLSNNHTFNTLDLEQNDATDY